MIHGSFKMKIALQRKCFRIRARKVPASRDSVLLAILFIDKPSVTRRISRNPSLFANALPTWNFENEPAGSASVETAKPHNGLLNFPSYMYSAFFFLLLSLLIDFACVLCPTRCTDTRRREKIPSPFLSPLVGSFSFDAKF